MEQNQTQQDEEHNILPEEYNTNTITRFACKMCRTIIFNQNDIENPLHTKSKHSFSSRKTRSGSNVNLSRDDQCQSIFLAEVKDWMGVITESHEGKLSCPKCKGKLGMYKWHGTQCSCGTWVVPAIMIHKSRIDVVPPTEASTNPTPAVFHPLTEIPVEEETS
mmetsp:Transcript_4890/g.9326  ORF Transcript_4890/g.9326 Transcript_4890/m.9326 type:complete len:163 (-) Transcript_4890:66-554(-)